MSEANGARHRALLIQTKTLLWKGGGFFNERDIRGFQDVLLSAHGSFVFVSQK